MFGKHHPILVIRSGSRKGKRLRLRRESVTLGSDSKCQVVFKDPMVEKQHATLRRRERGQWEIENHSVNGTHVDKMPVQKKILRHGSLIRLGQGTLLEFTLPDSAEARAASNEASGAKEKGKGIGRSALVGIGVWYVVLMVFFVYLGSAEETTSPVPVLTVGAVNEALTGTRDYLSELQPFGNGVRSLGLRIDPHSEEAADYFELIYRESSTVDTRVRSSLRVNNIVEKLEALFQSAWHLEAQQRWPAALEVYRSITRTVPDIRCPATRLATDRIQKLRQVMNDGG